MTPCYTDIAGNDQGSMRPVFQDERLLVRISWLPNFALGSGVSDGKPRTSILPGYRYVFAPTARNLSRFGISFFDSLILHVYRNNQLKTANSPNVQVFGN